MTLIKYRRPMVDWPSMNSLFDEFFGRSQEESGARVWRPAMDVVETEKNFRVDLNFPGFDKKDIKVEVKNGMLTVSAGHEEKNEEKGEHWHHQEIARGSYIRSLSLPDHVDPNNIDATYKSGILSLTLVKKEEAQPKQIEIKVK